MIRVAKLFSVTTLILLAFFTQQSNAADITILLGADVPPYHQAIKGFIAETNHNVRQTFDMKGDFELARGILSSIKEESQTDLIFAVGVWALKAAIYADMSIPIVYAMVLNPPSLVGIQPNNITGASMNVAVNETLQLIRSLNPGLKRIGTFYSEKNTGFLIESAKAIAEQFDVEIVAAEIGSSKEAMTALQDFESNHIDLLWIIPEKLVLAPDFVQEMLLFSYRNRIPSIGFSNSHAELGALLTLAFASSEDIGKQAAELANLILSGKTIETPGFTTARETSLTINRKTAHKLGIELSPALLDRADRIIE